MVYCCCEVLGTTAGNQAIQKCLEQLTANVLKKIKNA